jgi:hypothetical protein
MAPVSLKKLVDTKLLQKKITADDAREVLGAVEKDKKFKPAEVAQLKRLAELPASRFERKQEYFPNPNDPEDGVYLKTDPKKWIQGTVELATAKLEVKSSIPELSFKLSEPKEIVDEDYGSHFSRMLDVTAQGKAAAKAGTIAFSYGAREVSLEVKAGEPMSKIINRIESALLKKEGAMSVNGFYDEKKTSRQTISFEVL